MKKTIEGGIEWTYRPKVVYTAMYRGWNINIRYCAPMDWMTKCKSGPKRNWRLHVTRNGGGSIAFDHQLYATLKEAKQSGIALVDGHPATPPMSPSESDETGACRSEPKYSPGPWGDGGEVGHGVRLVGCGGHAICVVYGTSVNPNSEADTALIVAAPDLYEALAELHDSLLQRGMDFHSGRVRSALARARVKKDAVPDPSVQA